MQPIKPEEVDPRLAAFVGRTAYLHLETTAGAYTDGGFGAFIRNAVVRIEKAALRGTGPYRAGLNIDRGFVYAEGLTHWEADAQGRLLLEGRDDEGRLTVCLHIGTTPFEFYQ